MRLTLRQRLLVSFFAAIVLVAGLALGLGVRAIVVSVFDQAKEQVGLDLKTASALLAWDGTMEPSSVAAHLFSRTMVELCRAAGGDEAGRLGLRKTILGHSCRFRSVS